MQYVCSSVTTAGQSPSDHEMSRIGGLEWTDTDRQIVSVVWSVIYCVTLTIYIWTYPIMHRTARSGRQLGTLGGVSMHAEKRNVI